jgi:two-component system, OmpR family, sensor histidine kinase BaeS
MIVFSFFTFLTHLCHSLETETAERPMLSVGSGVKVPVKSHSKIKERVEVKLKIKHKLFLALLFTSVVVSLSIHFFVKFSFERGFKNYVKAQEVAQLEELSNQLVEYFGKEGNWEFIEDNHRLWQQLHQETSPDLQPQVMQNRKRIEPRFSEGPPGRGLGGRDGVPGGGPGGIGRRIALYDADLKLIIGGRGESQTELKMNPMEFQENTIGYLGLIPEKRLFDRDLHFLREQGKVFALIPILIVAMSLLISFPLTTHLLRPIQAMTEGTRKLIAGKFKTRIPVITADELGVLSKDFNSLATTLEKNEQNRKQWVADVSHELRTPLAILRGEIEALQDGVRQGSPHTYSGLHGEVMHLERMVSDLYELSMSDIGALNYKRIIVDPLGILQSTVEMFEQRMGEKSIELVMRKGEVGVCFVLADPDRLQQLFSNILENSLRYTNAPGMVQVVLSIRKNNLAIIFSDSFPTVPEKQLSRLFERFYRVESSRNRGTGGAGLGLAICKNIIDGHEGTIKAASSPLGGVLIHVELPLAS